MKDVIKTLSSDRLAKTLLKAASSQQLSRIIDVITTLKTHKEQEEHAQKERDRIEHEELEAVRLQILEKGIDFDKLAQLMQPKKRVTKKRSSSV